MENYCRNFRNDSDIMACCCVRIFMTFAKSCLCGRLPVVCYVHVYLCRNASLFSYYLILWL